jgi:hypothetical protein
MSLARPFCCAVVVLSLQGASALGDPPTLSHTLPLAVQPGSSTDVTLHGGALTGSTGVWTSFAANQSLTPDVAENGTQPAQVSYRLDIPADTPVGIAGLRLGTTEGISNLLLIMVDDLPSVAENNQNNSFDAAQTLASPIAVDGKIDAEQSDFYRIHATAGARITVEAVARRLGFALDPVVRLLDASGKELVYADDDPSLGPDCRFAFDVPAEGDYTLEIRDIRYQGGDAHRYRLRIGNFPLVSTTFPLAARKGRESQLEAAGNSIAGMGPMTLALAADCSNAAVPMGVKLPDGAGSTAVTVASSDWDELVETEPNDAQGAANAVALPGAINGRMNSARDRDRFAFHAAAGTRYTLRLQTRSLGSPADLSVRILNADGGTIAELENSGGGDRELEFQSPADADYRIAVEELYRRSGPDFTYRVEVIPFEPGFTLTAEADKWDVPRGGVLVTKVTSARKEFNGPITLSLEGLGEGVQLSGNVIPEGQNETNLQITLPASIESGRFTPAKIVGRAELGGKALAVVAQTRPLLTAAFNGLAYPPAALNGVLGLGVGPVFPDFFKLTLDRESIAFPRLVGTSTFTIKSERLNGFEEGIALSLEGLPPGVTADIKPLEKGQNEVAVSLTGPALLSDNPYPLQLVGQATFRNQPKRIVLADVPFKVVDPLQARGEQSSPLTAGASSPLKVQITRFGDAAPVRVSLANLPPGVTSAGEVTVAADQQEIELPLTAAAETAAGAFDGVALIAASEVKGQAVVTRTPITITITAKTE